MKKFLHKIVQRTCGRDAYIFNRGDGGDTVYDTKSDNNIFRFGAGISSSDITLRLGSLMLDLGNGDAVHIDGFNQNDVFNSSSIGSFEFADGSTLSISELLARGFDLDGTNLDDTGDTAIFGTNTTDRINGLGGNNTHVHRDAKKHLYVDVGNGEDMLRWRTRAGKVNSGKAKNIKLIQLVVLDVQAWGIAA